MARGNRVSHKSKHKIERGRGLPHEGEGEWHQEGLIRYLTDRCFRKQAHYEASLHWSSLNFIYVCKRFSICLTCSKNTEIAPGRAIRCLSMLLRSQRH